MNNAVTIINQSLDIKEYEGQRVITFADVDRVHERKEGTASKNFQRNKKHFVKGVDYFEICRQEVGDKLSLTYGFSKLAPKGILLTESGYLMIAKSMTDDLSWEVQRALVNAYFQVKTIVTVAQSNDDYKARTLAVKEQNAKIRTAQLMFKIAEKTNTRYREVLQARITQLLTGEYLLPLPEVEERTLSATEIGERLGISAHKVGMLANAHNLKTEKYGKWFYDKAKTADKQVETFRYFEKSVEVFKSLLEVAV